MDDLTMTFTWPPGPNTGWGRGMPNSLKGKPTQVTHEGRTYDAICEDATLDSNGFLVVTVKTVGAPLDETVGT